MVDYDVYDTPLNSRYASAEMKALFSRGFPGRGETTVEALRSNGRQHARATRPGASCGCGWRKRSASWAWTRKSAPTR